MYLSSFLVSETFLTYPNGPQLLLGSLDAITTPTGKVQMNKNSRSKAKKKFDDLLARKIWLAGTLQVIAAHPRMYIRIINLMLFSMGSIGTKNNPSQIIPERGVLILRTVLSEYLGCLQDEEHFQQLWTRHIPAETWNWISFSLKESLQMFSQDPMARRSSGTDKRDHEENRWGKWKRQSCTDPLSQVWWFPVR